MPDSRIVVFGATGYTGRLTVERLVAAGASPVLAGRSTDKLKRLADSVNADLETVKADVLRQNSVFSLVEEGDVLISLVGPFVKWGDPAVRAAIAAGATYLDSTGEPSFIRRIFEEFDGPAARNGAALMTAMGYDFVPGALAGALALEEGGEDAVRVDVGYYAFGAHPSAGTRETIVGVALDPSFAFRRGALVDDRPAAKLRTFSIHGKDRPGISTGAAEHFTLPAAYPRLQEVNTYIGQFGSNLAKLVQAGSLPTSLATRLPGVRSAMKFGGEKLMGLMPDPEEGRTAGALSWVVAEAYGADGRRLAEVHLSGADPYDFTAGFLSWAAQRAASAGVEGTGALGPVDGFGLDVLEAGVAEAGIERVAAPQTA